ncbi:MAG TPA: heme ABC transporter ATP-binding protein, partial [Actinobacteria bacterium]|nr:heme ABC transporter ATP-binding protein [Actinomycetota bacterium]
MSRGVVGRGLGYHVDGRDLIAGVDVAAAPGELLAIVGPNGAGKSTLINLLSGDLAPSGGMISLAGR